MITKEFYFPQEKSYIHGLVGRKISTFKPWKGEAPQVMVAWQYLPVSSAPVVWQWMDQIVWHMWLPDNIAYDEWS